VTLAQWNQQTNFPSPLGIQWRIQIMWKLWFHKVKLSLSAKSEKNGTFI